MAEIVSIKVSDTVRGLVQDTAKDFMQERGLKNEAFNQDCNAVVAVRVLKSLGVEMPKGKTENETKEKTLAVLQACKVLGNSSALRQVITGSKTGTTAAASEETVNALVGLVG